MHSFQIKYAAIKKFQKFYVSATWNKLWNGWTWAILILQATKKLDDCKISLVKMNWMKKTETEIQANSGTFEAKKLHRNNLVPRVIRPMLKNYSIFTLLPNIWYDEIMRKYEYLSTATKLIRILFFFRALYSKWRHILPKAFVFHVAQMHCAVCRVCVCVHTAYTSVERKRECVSRMHHELEVVFCFSLIVSFGSLFFHLSALSVLLVGCRSAEIVGVGSKRFSSVTSFKRYVFRPSSQCTLYICWIWFRPLWKYFGWFLLSLSNLLNFIYSNEYCFVFQFILVDFNQLKKSRWGLESRFHHHFVPKSVDCNNYIYL